MCNNVFTQAGNDFYVARANIELYKESFYITDHACAIRYQVFPELRNVKYSLVLNTV